MVKDSLYVSLEKASDGTQVAPEIPAADEAAVGDFLQRETKEMLPSGEEQALRSRYQACTSLPEQVERASRTDSTHDQDLGLDSMSRMPVKRWYEIEFSPTTFHKRAFIIQGLESFSPYSHRTETRGREPSLDDKGDVTWDIKTEDYVETRVKESGPPHVQEIVEDLQVQSGDTATFSTVIVGHPAPAVTWYKDGVVLSSSERVELHQQGSRFSLTVVDTSSQDCGVYTCAASNPWGDVSCKAELIVAEGSERSKHERKKRRKLHSLYEVHEEIGRGSFAFVRRAKCKGSGESCAAKFIPLISSNKAQALRERSVLSQLSHPRLACLLDSFYTRKTLVLLTELCSTQTLLDHLLSKESVPEKEVQNYIHQVLEGINYIHNKNILHLDIKPTNILMALSEKDEIKICDFGFAQEIDLSKPQYSRFGTPEFVAPEIVCQAPVTKATDIWSVGVLSYLCLTGSCLFFGENDCATLKNIQDGRISWDDPDVTSRSPEAQGFLQRVLQLFAEKRPTAAECLRHDWFLDNQSTREAELINTKKLKFFVSRSKWQCSLKSYGSVMVVRSIPDLLEGPFQETSLAVPRDHLDHSSSSPSSVSSSDYEDASCHRETDSMSTPEHLLPAKHRQHPEKSWEVEKESGEGFRTTDHCIELSQSSASDALPEVKKEEHSVLTPRKQILPDQGGVSSEFRLTVCKPDVTEAFRSSESTGNLSHEDSAGSSLSLDISEDDATGSTCVRIPRDSLIKSTFYSSSTELSPLSARRMFLQGKKYMKRHERARKHLMKAGLSSRLQEPLLEQFEESQNEGDDGGNQGRNLLYPPSVIAKSSSFDIGVRVSNSDISMKRRSRSLDEYHTRTPSPSELIEARRDESEDLASRVLRENEMQVKLFDSHPEKAMKESTQDDAENTGSFADECTLKEPHSERETVQQSELTTEDTAKAETPLSSTDSKVESAMLQSVISEMVSLSEEIKVISGFESPPENPDTSEFSLLAYATQDESTQRTEDSPSSVREPLPMKPIFVESTTPVSAVQEVSELLTSQYGLSEFESPRSFHLSLKALETLEEENRTHFPQLHVAMAKSEMRTSNDPPVLALAAEPTDETPATGGSLSFKEPYGSKYDLQGSFGEPEVIFSTPAEATCISVPSASHPQEPQVSPEEEFGIFHEHMSETASVKAQSGAYVETYGDDDNDLEPELQHLLEEVNIYENLNIAWRDTAFPVKSTSLVEVSNEKQSAEALTEQIHRPSSVPDSKHQPSKTGKYGILRFFRKHSSTDYPTSSFGQGSEIQTSEEKLGHSPSLYQQLQGASSLSLTKKMRASISCLPAAIWGKQRKETDKREGGEEEPHPELGTATLGSLRRKSKLFSFKLRGLKKSREPVFLEELQDMSVSLGQSVTLSCRLSGYPPPDICWYKEGQWIKSSSHIWLSVMDKELHSLTIHAAREEDLGSYRCVASNVVGQASTSCTLIVSEVSWYGPVPEFSCIYCMDDFAMDLPLRDRRRCRERERKEKKHLGISK
ncbi:obscurin-like isoform X2 [Lepisosteus oculatus]|uniref:obscurin-like isoform X2 n=1 Tax=Lepisosteus oculatus TaxID=7918 RepID=UPI0037236322